MRKLTWKQIKEGEVYRAVIKVGIGEPQHLHKVRVIKKLEDVPHPNISNGWRKDIPSKPIRRLSIKYLCYITGKLQEEEIAARWVSLYKRSQ